jgi:hypothetical protein
MSRNRRVSTMLLAATLCSLTGAVGKAQTTYTYTVIADLANCNNFGSPVINNLGEVAFGAHCGEPIGPVSGAVVIRKGDGGPLTPIFTVTGSIGAQYDVLSMNDSGRVAFATGGHCQAGGGRGIATGDGGPIDIVVDNCTEPLFTEAIRPSINNAGAVAFMADTGITQGYDSVFLVSGGTRVTIAGPGTATTSVGTLTSAIDPSINNNGVVTFTGQGATNFGLFTGSGGALTTVSVANPSTSNAIDDSNRVAFVEGSAAVRVSDGNTVTTIASVTATGYRSFTGGTSISAAGKVAFMATLQSSGTGVFTGPDPDADAVLRTGTNEIPGYGNVTGAFITREAINDSGQVAMLVFFEDRSRPIIIRADPPNSPPTALDGVASVTAGESVTGTLSATDPDSEPITYAIVTSGTKGTAVIDNTSTGAFTYTADENASGADAFTFKVTDIRGAESNVAIVTLAIQPPPPTCAVNVTSSVAPVKGKGSKNTSTSQIITLQNASSSAIAGPISIALDSLTAGVTLVNAAGVTSCAPPAGSPYVNVDVGADSMWSPGERLEVVLQFERQSTSPGRKASAISYTRRVLAGAGGR